MAKHASSIRQEVRAESRLSKRRGIQPKLAVILVGDDPASVLYRDQGKACRTLV